MESNKRVTAPSPPLVALFSWTLPGGGYLLLHQRGRALGVGITIIVLFLIGLLIGGVRVIEVPGYVSEADQEHMGGVIGQRYMVPVMVQATDRRTGAVVMEPEVDQTTGRQIVQWSLEASPLNEIRDKPWSVPQILAGPMAIASGAWSLYAAADVPGTEKINPGTGDPIPGSGTPIGALSHSRVNEIGSLYLSVAGLLNLMAIIDATWRASHMVVSSTGKETA